MGAHRMCGLVLTVSAGAASAQIGDPFADRVVYSVVGGEPVYEPGAGDDATFGPFASSPLWSDPGSVLGKPNTLDYNDAGPFGPVEGGFAGGPMRRVTLIWPAWQYGSSDAADLGERPGFLDGRRRNGVTLNPGAQITIEFNEPIENNPDDGGAWHWGIDLVVHGNSFFVAGSTDSTADTDVATRVLTGGVFAEPLVVEGAQQAGGPWYRFAGGFADDLFPTQPWAWDGGGWSGEEQDWTKPVDPALTGAAFGGKSGAQAIAMYEGSAGGSGFDLDDLVDDQGAPVPLEWIRFVRVRDELASGGEITGFADMASGPPCPVDLAAPPGVVSQADVAAFVDLFFAGDARADLAEPEGVVSQADVARFVELFFAGCGS
ncbi:MAG: GC-type dockerin domain-anchored protein [Planctomycetota bacterium]